MLHNDMRVRGSIHIVEDHGMIISLLHSVLCVVN